MDTIPTVMARHGLTVETLAPALGMSVRVLTGRLSGRTDWSFSEILAVVENFNSLAGSNEYTISGLFFPQEQDASQ